MDDITTPLKRGVMTFWSFLVVSYNIYYLYGHAEINCNKIFNPGTVEDFYKQSVANLEGGHYDDAIFYLN